LQEVLHVKPQRAKLRFANKKQGFLLALQKWSFCMQRQLRFCMQCFAYITFIK
jgi:hypothetical protein